MSEQQNNQPGYFVLCHEREHALVEQALQRILEAAYPTIRPLTLVTQGLQMIGVPGMEGETFTLLGCSDPRVRLNEKSDDLLHRVTPLFIPIHGRSSREDCQMTFSHPGNWADMQELIQQSRLASFNNVYNLINKGMLQLSLAHDWRFIRSANQAGGYVYGLQGVQTAEVLVPLLTEAGFVQGKDFAFESKIIAENFAQATNLPHLPFGLRDPARGAGTPESALSALIMSQEGMSNAYAAERFAGLAAGSVQGKLPQDEKSRACYQYICHPVMARRIIGLLNAHLRRLHPGRQDFGLVTQELENAEGRKLALIGTTDYNLKFTEDTSFHLSEHDAHVIWLREGSTLNMMRSSLNSQLILEDAEDLYYKHYHNACMDIAGHAERLHQEGGSQSCLARQSENGELALFFQNTAACNAMSKLLHTAGFAAQRDFLKQSATFPDGQYVQMLVIPRATLEAKPQLAQAFAKLAKARIENER